jgi:NADH-quinone oxidoreductase subunit L
MPPFSGWLSKDDIIGYLDYRGGAYAIFGVLGYVGALMTGVYTFRMIFRAFWGEPCEEASELRRGHQVHHDPVNPLTGEPEDTDVGFPGPAHPIAEREREMKVPMSILAVLALIGGIIQIPGVDAGINRFLSPTFANSRLAHIDPTTATSWEGLIIGAVVAVAGIAIAYRIYVARPGTSAALIQRFGAVHTFLVNKWYFDELIEFLVVRPAQWLGRFTETVLEQGVIAGGITGGTTGLVRGLSAAVRRLQTGFVRYYAAAMLVGVFGMALYFLISSTAG